MGAEDTAGGERRSDGEEQIAILPRPADRTIRSRYNKSFVAKLMQSSDDIKEYYAELANELFAHDKIRNCISWANSSFCAGRKTVSKFSIRGKSLYFYLALHPQDFRASKYPVTDESAVRRYEAVPLRVKVRSRSGVKYGKERIGILMRESGILRLKSEAGTVKPCDYRYDTTIHLIRRGLMKVRTKENATVPDTDRPVWADFERRSQVSVAEAQSLISDEAAVRSKPKAILHIDTLSESYRANDTVTLESLKEKRLVGRSVNHGKVLARDVPDKPLTVRMPEFSVDAVKMILLTGGKAISLKKREP